VILGLSFEFPRPKQALEKKKPLKNQRLFGILVEGEGFSNLHHRSAKSLTLLGARAGLADETHPLGVPTWELRIICTTISYRLARSGTLLWCCKVVDL
jgi:hypothetical protein